MDVLASGLTVYNSVSVKLSHKADGAFMKAKLVDIVLIGTGLSELAEDLLVFLS